MEKHVKIVSWLYIIMGILGVLGAIFVFLIVTGAGWISGDQTAARITFFVAVVIASFMALTSIPGVIAGFGLLRFKNWARILGIILGILNLPGFPVGTALGIYTLYILLDDESSQLFLTAGTSS
jgi:hypothetical protein